MARILDAARYVFASHPFDRALMDDVATRAKVGKGTIYRYFPDKESLYFAVIFAGINELGEQIRASADGCGDMDARIRALIQTLVSFFRRNRLFFRLMSVEDSKVGGERRPNRKRWHRERDGLIAAIADALQHGHDTGVLEVPRPRTAALILMGMVRSVIRHHQDELTEDEMIDEIARVFLHGLQPRTLPRRTGGHKRQAPAT